MPNYGEMYLKMFRASEKAINLIIAAQQECEALYIDETPPALQLRILPDESIDEVE